MTTKRSIPAPGLARRVLSACGLAFLLALSACGRDDGPRPAGRWVFGELDFAEQRHELGPFEVRLEGTRWSDARLRVLHVDRPEEAVLETPPGTALLEIGRGRARAVGQGAALRIEDEIQERCSDASIDAIESQLYVLRIAGRSRCAVLERAWELFLVPEGRGRLRFQIRVADPSFNRVALLLSRHPEERFFGLGARSRLDLAGFRVPILLTPPPSPAPTAGLAERLSRRMGRASRELGGSPAPIPRLLSARLRTLELESAEYAVFDLQASDRLRIESFQGALGGRLTVAPTPLALLQAGARPETLPAWIHSGPILEVDFDSEGVVALARRLGERGAAPAAVLAREPLGDGMESGRMWRLADLDALTGQRLRLLSELSPTLPARQDIPTPGRVETADGSLLVLPDGRALADLSDPAVGAWLAEQLRDTFRRLRASGVRTGRGASLPWEARIAGGRPAEEFHNGFAAQWIATAGSALQSAVEAGVVLSPTAAGGVAPGGIVFEAGEARDPAAVSRMLSAGLSGLVYPALRVEAASLEELERSLALVAFVPVWSIHARLLAEPGAQAALGRWARVHAAWSGYRSELVRQAVETGAPLLRPLWLHHPETAGLPAEPRAFLVGSELLVASPEKDRESVTLTLPAGRWIDAFTGEEREIPEPGQRATLPAPGGRPAVLYPEGSIVGDRLRKALAVGGS